MQAAEAGCCEAIWPLGPHFSVKLEPWSASDGGASVYVYDGYDSAARRDRRPSSAHDVFPPLNWATNGVIFYICAENIWSQVHYSSDYDITWHKSTRKIQHSQRKHKHTPGLFSVPRDDLELWPLDPNISGFPGFMVERFDAKFGCPSCIGFWDIMRLKRQTNAGENSTCATAVGEGNKNNWLSINQSINFIDERVKKTLTSSKNKHKLRYNKNKYNNKDSYV